MYKNLAPQNYPSTLPNSYILHLGVIYIIVKVILALQPAFPIIMEKDSQKVVLETNTL